MTDGKPSIYIGVPCFAGVDPRILEDWMRWAFYLGRFLPQYYFFIGIKSKSEQFRARQAIVESALQVDADWILMMDDDHVIDIADSNTPSAAYGFIEKLIAHDKDICGVRYYQRGGACDPVLMMAAGENGYRFLRDDEITNGLQEVDVAGGGCLLIRTKIFDRLAYPYFAPEHKWGTDVQLCQQAKAKGFNVWADTSIEIGHLKAEKVVVTSANRHRIGVADRSPDDMKRSFIVTDIYQRLAKDAMEYTGERSEESMWKLSSKFMEEYGKVPMADEEWYRLFPKERVCRQVSFNMLNANKKTMTEYILGVISHHRPLRILDFGCGIGITAFALAEKGHQVTALDIRGTGTLEFLKWRTRKYSVPMEFIESDGGPPLLGNRDFDVIIAMDSIEHVAQWNNTLETLARHLKPEGLFFSNNGILEDESHPEHYAIDNRAFIKACLDMDMMPQNAITYLKKKEVPVYA